MQVYKFKVKEYTTILVGQKTKDIETGEIYFYIQRGDGSIYSYNEYRIEFYELIYDDEKG